MRSLARKIENEYFASKVRLTDDSLCVFLTDGREIKVPLEYYPRLKRATKKQRNHFKLIGLGSGIHWPGIDEDLSVEGIVLGRKSISE